MRRALLLLLVAGCRSTPKETPPPPVASVTPAVVVDAAPPPEAPLTWGTRPSEKGPFFPVVDGMCIHGEIWPVGDRALFTYGNGTGAYTKGSEATFARLEDDGLVLDPKLTKVTDKSTQEEFARVSPVQVRGTWPSLVLYSNDRGASRLRIQQSIWKLGDEGWTALEAADTKDEPQVPAPVVFKGWLVTIRSSRSKTGEHGAWENPVVRSWPLEKDATPIPNLTQLERAGFIADRLAVTSDSIYAFGEDTSGKGNQPLIRVLTDGKVIEAQSEGTSVVDVPVTYAADKALIEVTSANAYRYDGAKKSKLPFKLVPGVTITGSAIAPNGDIWINTSKSVLMVIHDGAVTETPLPAPAAPKPKEGVQHWPSSGNTLAGIELGDPWAIGQTGSLFHFEADKWTEVELPTPPFATVGKYQAQALLMKTKGDLYINAGYAEKGIGWKTPERYRAVLRQKRPKEVLRCNEPVTSVGYETGAGFSSSPPVADDACATPFVVLLRLGSVEHPNWLYDRQSNYSSIRKVVKETASLGASVDIVEFAWNGHMVVGLRAPTVAAAREFALAAAKAVKSPYLETRPEVVCGIPPKIEKTIPVDVATGNTTAPVGSAK